MARLNCSVGDGVRRLGVVLCLMSLFDQFGATCTDQGHASVFSSVIRSSSIFGSDKTLTSHKQCCHHGDHGPQIPDTQDQSPTSPLHLCSATHAVFIAPCPAEMPDLVDSSPIWLAHVEIAVFLQLPALTDAKSAQPDVIPSLGAPTRAELQVFQI